MDIQYIFIDSASAQGDNNDFTVFIPDNAVAAQQHQSLRISLRRHYVQNTLWNVNPGDAIVIDDIEFPLVPGAYKVQEVVTMFNSLSTPLTITYNNLRNTFTFTSVIPSVCEFIGTVKPLFGTPSSFVVVPETPFEGQQVRPAIPSIVLYLNNELHHPQTQNWFCIDSDKNLQTSEILSVIPMRAPPRTMNEFVNDFDDGAVTVIAKNLDKLSFSVRDTLGNKIYGMSPCQFLLKIEYLDSRPDPSHKHLRDLKSTMNMLLQIQSLKFMRKTGDMPELYYEEAFTGSP